MFSFSLLLLPGRERGRKEEEIRKKSELFLSFLLHTGSSLICTKKSFLATFIRGDSLSTLYCLWERNSKGLLYRRQKFGKPRGVTNWFVPSKKKEEEEEKELVNFSLSLLLAITDRKWLSDTRQNNDIIFEMGKAEFEGNRSFLADFEIWHISVFPFHSFLSLILFLWQYLPASESIYIFPFLPFLPDFVCQSQSCAAVIRISGLPSSMNCSMACVPPRPNYCQKGRNYHQSFQAPMNGYGQLVTNHLPTLSFP